MKRKLFILALLFVSVFTFFVNNFSSNSEELGVRDVYIEDNKYDLSYFENKYDIYNNDISSFEINEIYDSSNDLISNKSLEDEYKIKYKVNVNKIEQWFSFSYILYINDKIELTSSVKVDIIEYDNEYYFSSSNGYISPCSELYESSNMAKCAAIMYTSFDDTIGLGLLSDRFGLGGGGGGGALGAIALGATVGTVAGMAILNPNLNSSNNSSIEGDGGVGSNESASAASGGMLPDDQNNNKNNDEKKDKVKELSDEISEDYKQNFKCEEYADALENKMKANDISGERIKVTPNTGFDYIYSDEFGAISNNGYHYGIKVDNYVFDNLHPQGVEYSKWLKDLGGELYNIIKVIRSW